MKYCEAYAALLDPYVDGELSGEEAARVRAHLADCPGCIAYVEDALAIRAAFAEIEDMEPPENFTGGVMAAIEALESEREAERRPPSRTMGWKKVLLPLAACFALVAVLRYGSAQGGDAAAPTAAPAAFSADGAESATEDMPADNAAFNAAADCAPAELENGILGESQAEEPGKTAPGNRMSDGENGQTVYFAAATPEAQKTTSRAIWIRSARAEGLLEGMDYTLTETGWRRYCLTAEEYDSLLAVLEDGRAEIVAAGDVPETEPDPGDGYLVYLTEE